MKAEQIVEEMQAEIKRRDEWYGLDNWPVSEVVQFVVDRLDTPKSPDAQHPGDPSKPSGGRT